MRTHQARWVTSWSQLPTDASSPDVVLLFGAREAFEKGEALTALAKHVPPERCFGCSTAGEIEGAEVLDETIIATFIWFEHSHLASALVTLDDEPDAEAIGRRLGAQLSSADLRHVLVFSDGTRVNGSALVRGLRASLPSASSLSGGLSGDGAAMQKTVICHQGQVFSGAVSALAFSGELDVGIGSMGGWTAFGPSRTVTKSSGNVLHELDGEPALTLYKRYLGHHAEGLPASALLFPLEVRLAPDEAPVVRTILGVDEAAGTLTFAGDVPEGSRAQLMRATFDRLVDAGTEAATASATQAPAQFALLVSCVGRKLVLKQRVEEEVEAVRAALGPQAVTTGFYSYGEIAPRRRSEPCQLHNQTMTVTTFAER